MVCCQVETLHQISLFGIDRSVGSVSIFKKQVKTQKGKQMCIVDTFRWVFDRRFFFVDP